MECSSKKRSRASRPKARTGCITCKIRRVKCDEAKPHCLRCQKFGRQCDGYESKEPPRKRVMYPSIAPNFQPILYQPTALQFQSEEEHRCFRLFSDRIAPKLSGFFESALWNRLIMQASESDLSIRHAVIAIAALKKTSDAMVTSNGRTIREIGRAQSYHEFALRQYSKAIRSMRHATIDIKHNLRTTLISCIVITCFETFHGNHKAAAKQVVIGLGLIENHLLNLTSVGHREDIVEDDLIQAFAGLDIQAMTFVDPRKPERHRMLKAFGQSQINGMPTEFGTLQESKRYLELTMQRLMHLMASAVPHHSMGCLRLDISLCIPDEYIDERESHLAEMRRWHDAFAPLLKRAKDRTSDFKSNLGAMALELVYQTCYFAAAVIRSSSQHQPETLIYMPTFIHMVSVAKSILEHPCVVGEKSMFGFEMHVICPLYTVAWRCPQRTLRREAISLLLSRPWREGFWDSLFAGKLAEWVMLMEEENFDGEYAPERLRSSGVDVLDFSMEDRKAHVRCSLPNKDCSGCTIKETVITW